MDILDDMGVSKLSAKVFFKSALLLKDKDKKSGQIAESMNDKTLHLVLSTNMVHFTGITFYDL